MPKGLPIAHRRLKSVGFSARHLASIGRRVMLRKASGPNATAASRIIGTSNAAVTYNAPLYRGAAGNSFRVAHVIPAGAAQPLSIVVSGRDITVNGATAAAGVSSSTATQVAAAINANVTVSDLGITAVAGGTGASPIVAGALTAMTGGT